jgi:hypothetical protein
MKGKWFAARSRNFHWINDTITLMPFVWFSCTFQRVVKAWQCVLGCLIIWFISVDARLWIVFYQYDLFHTFLSRTKSFPCEAPNISWERSFVIDIELHFCIFQHSIEEIGFINVAVRTVGKMKNDVWLCFCVVTMICLDSNSHLEWFYLTGC